MLKAGPKRAVEIEPKIWNVPWKFWCADNTHVYTCHTLQAGLFVIPVTPGRIDVTINVKKCQ